MSAFLLIYAVPVILTFRTGYPIMIRRPGIPKPAGWALLLAGSLLWPAVILAGLQIRRQRRHS